LRYKLKMRQISKIGITLKINYKLCRETLRNVVSLTLSLYNNAFKQEIKLQTLALTDINRLK